MERLAELRERRALTLRELAEMSGVAADTINQIELGHRKARPSTLRKLARALEVDAREFFEEPALPKAEAPSSGQATKIRPINDNLDVVDAVRDAILLQDMRERQADARAETSHQPQTTHYGSGTPGSSEDLERYLKERFDNPRLPEDWYETMLFSALWNSVRRYVQLKEENAQLKEELATTRERQQTYEESNS